jgi:hypothetical protein
MYGMARRYPGVIGVLSIGLPPLAQQQIMAAVARHDRLAEGWDSNPQDPFEA